MTAPEPRVQATEWTVTAIPEDHPNAYLFKLLIEPMRRGDGVEWWRVKRRLGPDWLCRRTPDPRGIEECRHREGCRWDTWDEAVEFAKRLAPTLAVINSWGEDDETPRYIDVAQAIELGELP